MYAKVTKKIYKVEMELDEHQLSLLQATLGVASLPKVVHESFVEYSEDELKELYDTLRLGIEQTN